MANVQKYNASAVGHMAAHYERRMDGDGNYIKFGNQQIDLSRTHLNYNLAPTHEGGQVEFIRQRTSEVRCQKRADVNVMCSWVVTMPKNYRLQDENIHAYPNRKKVEELFFQETYKFLADRYGEKNVISAYVHMDEKSPHMHFSFVPVSPDRRRGGEKVSAKEVLTKADLQAFHGDLEIYLSRSQPWRFDVLNDATKDGNRTVAELKKETYHQEVEEAKTKAANALKTVESIQNDVEHLRVQKDALNGEIDVLRTTKEVLTASEVEAIQGSKNIIGGLKGVTYKEFESLKSTAAKVDDMIFEKNKAMERAEHADHRAAAAEKKSKQVVDDAKKQLAAKIREVEQDRPSLNMQIENIRLQRENTDLKSTVEKQQSLIERLLSIIKEKLPDIFKILVQGMQAQQQNKQQKKRTREYDMER
jgi:Plasmid recombination enzyme.